LRTKPNLTAARWTGAAELFALIFIAAETDPQRAATRQLEM
jgi:hypothetical protein